MQFNGMLSSFVVDLERFFPCAGKPCSPARYCARNAGDEEDAKDGGDDERAAFATVMEGSGEVVEGGYLGLRDRFASTSTLGCADLVRKAQRRRRRKGLAKRLAWKGNKGWRASSYGAEAEDERREAADQPPAAKAP